MKACEIERKIEERRKRKKEELMQACLFVQRKIQVTRVKFEVTAKVTSGICSSLYLFLLKDYEAFRKKEAPELFLPCRL